MIYREPQGRFISRDEEYKLAKEIKQICYECFKAGWIGGKSTMFMGINMNDEFDNFWKNIIGDE